MFADGIITAITRPALGVVKELSAIEAEAAPKDLAAPRLRTEVTESQNFIIAPVATVGKAFRRIPDAYKIGEMQTNGGYDTMELLSKRADWIGEGRLAGYARLREGQPYQIAEEMEILGVAMEKRLSSGEKT